MRRARGVSRRARAPAAHGGAAWEAHRAAARGVRRLLAEVYGAAPEGAVLLAPGTSVALRLLFSALGVRRITLSASEYYGPPAFPDLRVRVVPAERVAPDALRGRPDAVVMSVVSWRGERMPMEETFARIRSTLGRAAPLLVADYSHAGAAGFPRVGECGADVVAGDAGKWITPVDWDDRVGFVWLRTPALRLTAREAFASLYLATTRPRGALEGRWVDPDAAARIAAWARGVRGLRRRLLERHVTDHALAAAVAQRCGLPHPDSALVWVPSGPATRRIPAWARWNGLLWRMPDGAVRVTCRADAVDAVQVRPGRSSPGGAA